MPKPYISTWSRTSPPYPLLSNNTRISTGNDEVDAIVLAHHDELVRLVALLNPPRVGYKKKKPNPGQPSRQRPGPLALGPCALGPLALGPGPWGPWPLVPWALGPWALGLGTWAVGPDARALGPGPCAPGLSNVPRQIDKRVTLFQVRKPKTLRGLHF